MIARDYTPDQVRTAFVEAVAASGGAKAWGEQHGLSDRHVRAMAAGERPISRFVERLIGFERRTVIVRRAA